MTSLVVGLAIFAAASAVVAKVYAATRDDRQFSETGELLGKPDYR